MELVRMGELAVSDREGEQLVSMGLGSCVGLIIRDRRGVCAGLAHVVLPGDDDVLPPATDAPAKFADPAVELLVARLGRLGTPVHRLEAALVGGASMFAFDSGLEIGARNVEAVRRALAARRIAVQAEQTGGSAGRTVRVWVGGPCEAREAGRQPVTLLRAPMGTTLKAA
jgi:chemotaxis protein CheD